MMIKIKKWILSLGFALFLCNFACANPIAEEKFISLSDIHFTPYAGCKTFSLRACPLIKHLQTAPAREWKAIFAAEAHQPAVKLMTDTNDVLLESSLAEVKIVAAVEHPTFALYIGDALAHNYRAEYIYYSHDESTAGYQSFVAKTLEFLSAEIRAALPGIDIYPTIGNNDSYTGDYSVRPNGQFLYDTAMIYSTFILNEQNRKQFQQEFVKGGYYSISLPLQAKHKIIILDTVLFSPEGQDKSVRLAAQAELKWLHEELKKAEAQQEKVLLMFHIPVGVNVYKTMKSLLSGIQEFWIPEYSEAFQQELASFPKVIVGILPGHIHIDSYELLALGIHDKVPVTFTPSISPIFGNNPAFKVYAYDANTFRLLNYDVYSFPLDSEKADQSWHKAYHFRFDDELTYTDCELMQGLTTLSQATNTYTHLPNLSPQNAVEIQGGLGA